MRRANNHANKYRNNGIIYERKAWSFLWIVFLVIALIIATSMLVIGELTLSQPESAPGRAGLGLTGALIAIFLLLNMFCSMWTRIRVDADARLVHCDFGPISLYTTVFSCGFLPIMLDDVVEVTEEYFNFLWGYGVRVTTQGCLFRLGGSECVKFRMRSGPNVILASSDAQGLMEAVNSLLHPSQRRRRRRPKPDSR